MSLDAGLAMPAKGEPAPALDGKAEPYIASTALEYETAPQRQAVGPKRGGEAQTCTAPVGVSSASS